jgi:acetoin utilization protein AcuB
MLARELINDKIPSLKPSDTGQKSLDLMSDYKLTELPLVEDTEFLGLITENDILDVDNPKAQISSYKFKLEKPAVNASEHIYEVLSKISHLKLSLVPILDDDKSFLGVISLPNLVESICNLAAIKDRGGILQLELNIADYSLSEIASIVESNGAKILSSYIHTHTDSTKMDVTIKINQTDLSPIIQTFERYNYTVAASFHKSEMQDELKKRYNEFINYLNI